MRENASNTSKLLRAVWLKRKTTEGAQNTPTWRFPFSIVSTLTMRLRSPDDEPTLVTLI
jgi:hypothetical protein